MTITYIAINNNLTSPLKQINTTLKTLNNIPKNHILTISSFYHTPPLKPQNQPNYLNTTITLKTSLTPKKLLNHTQHIKLQQNHIHKTKH